MPSEEGPGPEVCATGPGVRVSQLPECVWKFVPVPAADLPLPKCLSDQEICALVVLPGCSSLGKEARG